MHLNGSSTIYKGWYEVSTSINISRTNLNSAYSYGTYLGKNGALIAVYDAVDKIGNNTVLKINNQIARYY